MSLERLPSIILFVLGLLALAKSIWGLVSPLSVKRVTAWWSGVARQVNTLTGCVCVLAGIALWTVILIDQPLVNWLLVIVGALYIWKGTLYFRPRAFQKIMNVMILDRNPAVIRIIFLITAIVAVLLIWAAVRG